MKLVRVIAWDAVHLRWWCIDASCWYCSQLFVVRHGCVLFVTDTTPWQRCAPWRNSLAKRAATRSSTRTPSWLATSSKQCSTWRCMRTVGRSTGRKGLSRISTTRSSLRSTSSRSGSDGQKRRTIKMMPGGRAGPRLAWDEGRLDLRFCAIDSLMSFFSRGVVSLKVWRGHNFWFQASNNILFGIPHLKARNDFGGHGPLGLGGHGPPKNLGGHGPLGHHCFLCTSAPRQVMFLRYFFSAAFWKSRHRVTWPMNR